MNDLTKKQRKHLRQLTHTAYEQDLGRCLEELAKEFHAWQEGDISVWDLNDTIHAFHNGTARELYKTYTAPNDPVGTVALAIASGILSLEEVDGSCKQMVADLSEMFRKRLEERSAGGLIHFSVAKR